jgi:Tfp pilus assembly protein PilN
MIRINLLPIEDRPRPRNLPLPDRISLVIYLVALLVVAAGGFSFFQQRGQIAALGDRRVELLEEEARLARQTKAIEQLEMQTALLSERLSVLRQLEVHRFDNVEWMNALNGVLPDRLWLDELGRNQGGARTTLTGLADGYQPVSRLMKTMEESGDFAGVQLMKAERTQHGKRSLIRFTVVADWGSTTAAETRVADENAVLVSGTGKPAHGGKR